MVHRKSRAGLLYDSSSVVVVQRIPKDCNWANETFLRLGLCPFGSSAYMCLSQVVPCAVAEEALFQSRVQTRKQGANDEAPVCTLPPSSPSYGARAA